MLCCESSEIIYLTNTNDSINEKTSIVQVLGQLKIYCPINKINSCQWIGIRADMKNHIIDCRKNYVDCIYGCNQIVNVNNFNHLDSCEHLKNGSILYY